MDWQLIATASMKRIQLEIYKTFPSLNLASKQCVIFNIAVRQVSKEEFLKPIS